MRLFQVFNERKKESKKEREDFANKRVAIPFSLFCDKIDFSRSLFSEVWQKHVNLISGTSYYLQNAENKTIMCRFQALDFIKYVNSINVQIFNELIVQGFVVFAKIKGVNTYFSSDYYSFNKNCGKITITFNFTTKIKECDTFVLQDPFFISNGISRYRQIIPFLKLHEIALNCANFGITKGGNVNLISPKQVGDEPIALNDRDLEALEKSFAKNYGIANENQSNFMLFRNAIDTSTLSFDFGKIGIENVIEICKSFICNILDVPKLMLDTNAATFANYETARSILIDNNRNLQSILTNFISKLVDIQVDMYIIGQRAESINITEKQGMIAYLQQLKNLQVFDNEEFDSIAKTELQKLFDI